MLIILHKVQFLYRIVEMIDQIFSHQEIYVRPGQDEGSEIKVLVQQGVKQQRRLVVAEMVAEGVIKICKIYLEGGGGWPVKWDASPPSVKGWQNEQSKKIRQIAALHWKRNIHDAYMSIYFQVLMN